MSLQRRYKKSAVSPTAVVTFSGPRLFTIKQAADYIGHSVDLVREMIAKGELPHVPKGSGNARVHKLLDRHDLDIWVERNKVAMCGSV
jgi:excisionase family DNA binding protein